MIGIIIMIMVIAYLSSESSYISSSSLGTSSGGFSATFLVDDSDAVDGDVEGLEVAASDDDDEVVEYDDHAEEGLEVATGDDDGEGHQHQCHQ